MTGDEAALLAALPAWAFAFVLVTARIGAAIALLPGLGEAAPPAMLRVGLALAVTVLLLPGIAPLIPPVPEAGMQAAFMVAAEVITGLWIGWLARLLVLALPIAGQFIAYMLGIANVLQPDPELGGQATPIARLFAVAAPLVILIDRSLCAAAGRARRQLSADPAGHAAARRGHRRDRRSRGRRGVRAWPCASPRPSCWSPSSGTSRPACSPGWCRACRSTSSPCQGRSSAASRCSPCWRPRC